MKLKIAVLPGDGVGPEVIAEAVKVLRASTEFSGDTLELFEGTIGAAAIRQTGHPLPPQSLDLCLTCDAVLLGAVGDREFDSLPQPMRPEAGLLQLRLALGGYANLRPSRAYTSLLPRSPFRPETIAGVDILVVRELLGGLYFGEPRGFVQNGSRSAFNTLRYSEEEIERVARVAFEQARQRRNKVTSVDKANVLESSHLWREVVTRAGQDFPDVTLEHIYVDACAMFLALHPRRFDVVLTENLFGDILSDQAASFATSLGMLPSATIGGQVDLYEPVHGSAPDIAGKDRANPLGAIASVAMLLRHTAGLMYEAEHIEHAIEKALVSGFRTADIEHSGTTCVSTSEMGDRIAGLVSDAVHQHHAYHAV